LKLKELTYTIADPYSSADFLHGPLALVEQGFPVFAIAPSGAVYGSIQELLVKLRDQFHAELAILSDVPELLALAQTPVPLPGGIPEWLSPAVAILPAQLFAYHLTRARGFSTETPRSIHKVTETS
jgi:glucosamine--fructose-6-phosphate aminotransferase (isomerizing)